MDDAGRIQAAYPFSATATEHVVQITGGPTVWSMCAIDAFGIPAMLGTDAVVTSSDLVTGMPIRAEFTGGRTTWQPTTAVYGTRPGTGPAAAPAIVHRAASPLVVAVASGAFCRPAPQPVGGRRRRAADHRGHDLVANTPPAFQRVVRGQDATQDGFEAGAFKHRRATAPTADLPRTGA